jgi:hypothetical protein
VGLVPINSDIRLRVPITRASLSDPSVVGVSVRASTGRVVPIVNVLVMTGVAPAAYQVREFADLALETVTVQAGEPGAPMVTPSADPGIE